MRRLLLSALVFGVVACAPDGSEDTAPTELPLISLTGPVLEIGLVDGADEYLFGQIESVLPLPDGGVAVSDASNTRISIYDAEGVFVRSWGRKGEGPGEFRDLSRIYLSGDSILAADQRTHDITPYSLDGTAGPRFPSVKLSEDAMFSLDSWLYGRFWVDGALKSEVRSRVQETLDALPVPRAAPGYRAVRATSTTDIWIREPDVSAEGLRSWTRIDGAGAPTGVIQVPVDFDPMSIQEDRVLGRWTGESEVSFVRAYQLAETGETREIPAWLEGTEGPAMTDPAPNEAEMRSLIVGTIKNMASHQEIFYSQNMTYTTDITDFEDFEQPEGLVIDFLVGNSRGWAGVFSHPGFDRICGLAYGFIIPAGWTPGSVVCSPAPDATNADGGA